MAQDNLKNLAATSETWGENDKPATAPSAADWGVGDKEYRPDAPARGFKGWAQDVAATAVKGAIGVPEAIVGVADIPSGGAVGKFLENEGGAVGFRPKQAKEIVNEWHSDATKEAQRKFQEADGIVDKAAVALQNPSLIATAVGESLPAMGLGGVAARGLMATTRLGQAGAAAAARGATAAEQAAAAQKAATIAGAAGEGLTMAGSAAEQIRQETPDGLLTPEQSGLAAATGVVGGAFGYAGGKLANRLGIGDAETMIAQGSKGMAKQAADDAAVAATNPLVQQAAKSIPRRVVEGAISEGFLEELPQSVAEQIFQNVALGKDWLQDVDSAVVMGVLSGGAMGGAAAGYHGMRQPSADGQNIAKPGQDGAAPVAGTPQAEAQPVNEGMARIQQAFADRLAALQQQEQGEPDVPQTAPPDGAAALAQQQAAEAARRQASVEASRAVASPDDEIFQSTGADVPRSVAMGINPAAGPLSASAALAVDTGAADQVQQSAALAQAAEVARKQGKKPAQDAQKQEQQIIAQQGVNQDTGEIQQDAQMDGWTDSQLSDAFRGAQSRDVRMQLAQELGRRRALREQQALQAELDAEQQGTVPGADRADGAFATLTEDAGPFDPAVEQPQSTPNTQPNQGWQKTPVPLDGQAQAAIENVAKTPQTNEGAPNGPQATQAQQDRAQPAQVGAAPTVPSGAPAAQGRTGAQGGQQPAATAGLTDAATTPTNPGAQAAPAAGAKAAPQAEDPAQRVARTGEAWTRMPTVERQALAQRADLKPIVRKNVHRAAWADLNRDVQRKLAEAMEPNAKDDATYTQAVELVRDTGVVKRPAIQDALGIGFDEVNALMDRMEREGIVTGAKANGARSLAEPVQKPAMTSEKQDENPHAALDQKASVAINKGAKDAKRQKAIQRVAEGRGWFLSQDKANAFVADSGLEDTHEVVQDQKRFVVQEKAAAQAVAPLYPVDSLHSPGRPDPKNSAAMDELEGFKPGDSVDVSGRNIGRSTVELVYRRQMAGFGIVPMARVVGADGKKLDVLLSELARTEQKSEEPLQDSPAREKTNADGSTIVGRRADGVMIRKDEKGVRWYAKDGVRHFETVSMRPTRQGMQVERGELKAEFMTEAERAENTTEKLKGTSADAAPVATKKEAKKDASTDYGASNKLVSQSRADELRAKLREKAKNHLFGGLDTEMMAWGTELAVFHLEAGVRKFSDLVAAMASDLGTPPAKLKPYLRSWYNGARDMMEDHGLSIDGMDSPETVRAELTKIGAEVSPESTQAATMEAQTRTTETKEVTNGNPEQAGRAADQGRTPEVSGRGGRDNDSAAPADSGDLEGRQPGDVPAAADAGSVGSDGVRVPAEDVGRAGPADQVGNAGNGRTRASRTPAPDAGAGKKRRVKAPEEVSPANPGPGNFHLDNPLEIVGGTPVARFDKNIAAIELLNQLRESERQATAEEQRTLAGYTGWGSFGQELFQGTWAKPMPKQGWEKRDQWLRDHLGQDEWESAQRSITNAHYTDPPTVMAMWDMVKRMGFSGGRVLEPSMGIGNFFGMMPSDIKGRSQLAGIELDSLTGAMATLLYPDANIKVMGYQESKTPDNFYDVVIGNWPFENTVIADRRYNTLSPFLHDYFFLKALDQVRPGGLVVGITSNGTMDKKATRIRAALARKAELVTSIRLPSGAFQEYAGTKVVTDIVILKKRDKALSLTPNEPWINSVAVKTPAGPEVFINEFYAQNPGNVIGTTDYGHGTTRMQPGMIVHRPENMAERLREAVNLVPEGVFYKEDRTEHISYVTNHTADREGSLSEQNGRLYVVRGEHLAPAQEVRKYALKSEAATAKREQELIALIDMRRKYAALIEAERDGKADDARKALREAYEAFGKTYGDMADSFGLDYLRKIDDPFYPALAALTVNGKPSDILTKSTIRGARGIENPTAQDAYVLARNKSVEPRLSEIAALAGKPEAEVRAELVKSGAVFEAPNGDVVPSDIYLSGNVRQKLREAKAALDDGNKAMERNVDELKKVIPEDVPYFNIESQLGATWVPAKAYAEYVAHMLNRPNADGIEATFLNGRWKIRLPDGANHWTEARTGFGTGQYPFSKLVNAAFTNQTVKIRRKDGDGNEYVDTEATDEANARIGDIRTKFGEWLWSDPERRASLEAEYNEVRNAYATPKYDGSFLSFDGMALSLGRGPFNLRQHQVNAIWRALVNRRSLNAHEVGTGKTFTMGGIAVESRRYGIAKKPVLLAHNANSASVAAEIQMMYPAAKVLYIDNLDKDSIAVRMRQIANDDWDTIVMPHSLIDRLSFREETLMEMAREDIRALEEEAYAAAEDDGVQLTAKMMDDEEELKKVRSTTAKELVKARNRIIETVKKQAMQSSREGAIPFEDLGIDMVLVDEVHEFKKPPISTRMNMKGLNTQTSNRSIALQFITRYIRANNFGGNVHTFTGTPITNTLTEIFHQMKYVMEDEMKAAGVDSWDGWFGSFAKEVQDVELSAAGEYEAINRLAGFINVPELRRMIGQYMDVVFADDMPEMQPRKVNGKTMTSADLSEAERAELLNGRTESAADRPYKKVINVTSDLTAEQASLFSALQGYARSWRDMTGKQRKEAMFNGAPESPIITEGLANKASFDVRLMQDEAYAGQEGNVPDSPGSKASKVVGNVLEIYKSDDRAAQVIFAEQGFSTSKDKSMGRDAGGKKITRRAKTFSTMRDIVERLVQGGIPREQIAIVDGSTSKEKRKEIADAMNALTVRVVIGSTDTLGVGVNMQRNLRAMHHMDAPYMPGELEQRNGRGLRQGNQWNTVLEYRYMTDRLDGRRWQILAIKQRFITAFMKANSDSRVIEGDAASDEESDIVQSFSEAAGDPRILIRAKLRKNVEALQRAERMHGNGVADARRNMRNAKEAIEWNLGKLREMTANKLPERLRAMMLAQSEAFTATVQGKTFDVRKDAEEAIDQFLKTEMRMEQSGVKVATYRDQTITARWPSLSSQPELVMEVDGQEFSSGGLRGLEQQIRNFPGRIERVEAVIAEREASIERLEQVSKAPFARAADLDAAKKRLEALEKDIEVNPVPPPAWLRAGAPVDSEAFRAGKAFVVTGHRWTKEGWFVLGQDVKGEFAVPYTEVLDKQGMPMYEAREFQAPEVIEKTKDADPLGASSPNGEENATFRRAILGGIDYAAMVSAVQNAGPYAQEKAKAVSAVQSTADAINKAWGPNAPEVVVAWDMNDPRVPEQVRWADLRQRSGGADGTPEGFYYGGKVYLLASMLPSANDVARVQYHEALGHHGLRGMFGAELDRILNQVAAMRQADVAAKMVEYGLKDTPSNRREAAEEVLAEMAQATPKLHFVRRAVAAIRNFLRSNVPGFKSLELKDDDIIQAYILPARGWVVRGGSGIGSDGVVSFSRSAMKSVDANIARGVQAMNKAILEKSDQHRAMHRTGLGWVDFVWGDDKRGIAHILAQRQAKDGMTRQEAIQLLEDGMVQTIAKGEEARRIKVGNSTSLHVDYQGMRAILVRSGGSNAWMLTGFQIRVPGGKKEGFDSKKPTQTATTPTRDGLGASTVDIFADKQDEGNPLFSRSKMSGIKESALAQIDTALSHPGKVSLWDKTVGTMRNLAERSPVFKPVYEAAQRFIDDVSMLGNDAADRAPRLLPRVETLADLKKKPITAADNQAVAKPLFEGTLMWARDLDGTPVTTEALNTKYRSTTPAEKAHILLRTGKIQAQMLKVWQGLPVEQFNTIINNKFESNILKPGVVWSAKELADLFGMNAAQVSLYQEARAAIDRSIDMTARADMLRALGAAYADLRDPVLAQATVQDAMTLITDTLQAEAREFPDQADRILSLNNAVVKSYERAKELMDAGYAPLSRFGRYTVDVVGKDGTREYFGMFESIYESNKMKAAMEKAFPGATITQGTMSAEAFKLFQGITPESLEQFGNMLGLSGDGSDPKDKAFQAYLQLSKNNHSALKRLIHRKGITGYSEDVGRVLASFVYSNARLAAGGLNAGTLEKAIEGIPKEQGELRDVAMGLRSYIQDPQEEGQAVRGMLFAQYLGGSVASALVNMTQPFQITMPWLSQYGGMRKAAAHLAGALRDMARRNGYEPDLAQALHTAEAEGIVSPQEIHQLMAQARGTGSLRTGDGTKMGDARAAAANNWERVKVAWGQPFALAEQFNRRSTFIAAYRMAKEQGMADPAKFAERAVLETQFVYSKANKPKWARGTIGGTLFTFKTYSVSYLELMHRMWTQGGPEGKRAVGWAVAMLLLVGGAGGLPFMEDAEDLIDGIGQLMGYNVSTKQWRKQALRDVLGKELADFVEQGVSGLPGAPVDVSGRLGMGNLIPGTGLLLSKQNRERDLLEVVGPAGDLISRGFTGARKALTGDLAGAALDVSPAAVRNAAKGIDMATSGIYKDTKGYKVIDTTLDEAIAKAIGFQPKSVAEVQESNSFMQRSKSFYIQTSSEIKAQWAKALFEKDEAALERVRERLADWNRNNADQPIVVKMPDVWKKVREMGKDRTQRIADTAPKALRQQMREMARENG